MKQSYNPTTRYCIPEWNLFNLHFRRRFLGYLEFVDLCNETFLLSEDDANTHIQVYNH